MSLAAVQKKKLKKVLPTESELQALESNHNEPIPKDVDLSNMDRFQKTQFYAMNFVSNRVNDINEDEGYQLRKAFCFVTCFVSMLVGVFLILMGLPATQIFSAFSRNWIPISFGILLCLPIFLWIRFMFLPDRWEAMSRKEIIRKRKERQSPTLFDKILKDSEELSKPPVTRVKIIARLRKKEYRVLASTWREFCEAIAEETGLPVEQQLIKYKHKPYKVELDKNIKDDCGFQGNEVFYVYNKGGYETTVWDRKYSSDGSVVSASQLLSAIYSVHEETLEAPEKTNISSGATVVSELTMETGFPGKKISNAGRKISQRQENKEDESAV